MDPVLKNARNNCNWNTPLAADDERYVPFSELGLRGSDANIMDQIETVFLTSDEPTMQLMSGHIGSGKSTELLRLSKRLEEHGFDAIYINTEDYLNLRVPATTLDLWVSIAAGVDRYVNDKRAFVAGAHRFWARFQAFLEREVEVTGNLKVPGVADIGIALKENTDFWQRLNAELVARRPRFVMECRAFVSEAVSMLQGKDADRAGVVILVDSFEKLRGDSRSAGEVRESAETILVRDHHLLKMPCHALVMVPPWLAFMEAGADNPIGRTCMLPMLKIAERTGGPFEPGVDAMNTMLERRMDLKGIFGGKELVRPLIECSGGYPRDLLRMMQEVLLRALTERKTVPLDPEWTEKTVKRVIEIHASQYAAALDANDADLYARIAKEHTSVGMTREQHYRLAELYDHHFVMSYQNGDRWLDLHPLVRDAALSLRGAAQENGGVAPAQ
ncbi:MAG: hypothetical protein FJX72_13070 [Armatimonadetes bacterium]|nr:hypothetical protein [Armatimonadota bacterium]